MLNVCLTKHTKLSVIIIPHTDTYLLPSLLKYYLGQNLISKRIVKSEQFPL